MNEKRFAWLFIIAEVLLVVVGTSIVIYTQHTPLLYFVAAGVWINWLLIRFGHWKKMLSEADRNVFSKQYHNSLRYQ
ncbi:hypothetical protein A2382_04095 [Candidatus Woesebacteria bacterium RIFOXYB1_FULL_38_16]|uniref:Uncharacterized protein n=1 Tax=Candidatus Woesebacteria bacterium RIFOXYB1_FULL_38_16 TaxID=1802538 RepID=A0A1F8CQZ5_9BACT|nr:MAG: hypothetical protein A2191_05090 [Candidatus Woesebacteria bacterium RIFOXYA1_FULL_38_9]OGM78720.1 MAG: hypothetical protein A2382_04095 [Candidatus Woesebacteria bacterium RIFOXYB1_FULL_38_16]